MEYFPLESAAKAIAAFHDVHFTAVSESDEEITRVAPDPKQAFGYEYAYERNGVALTWFIDIEPPGTGEERCSASVYVHLGATEPDDADDPFFIECIFLHGRNGWMIQRGTQRVFTERGWRLDMSFDGHISQEWVLYMVRSAIRVMKDDSDPRNCTIAPCTA